MPGVGTAKRGAVHRAGRDFGAQEIGGADLHARGTEAQCRRHAAGVGDAARGDHGHSYRRDDLRNQSERAELSRQVRGQEVAAVASGLEALGDDGVDAARLEPTGLVHGGSRREDSRAPGAHAGEQLGRWQPEVKADDRWLEFLDDVGRLDR